VSRTFATGRAGVSSYDVGPRLEAVIDWKATGRGIGLGARATE
jgi:hypothetical protein